MPESILIINDRRIDLYETTVVAINFQVNDIAELQDRQANYSQSFTVPPTDNNRAALGVSDDVTSLSATPYRKNGVKFISSGVEVVNEGICIVEEFTTGFRLTIYSGLIDFFSKIEGSITEIDLATVGVPTQVSLNFAGVSSLWNAPSGSDLILPLYQSGYIQDTSREVDISKHYRPALSFSSIIEAIFKIGGYTYTGKILSDSRFSRLFLPIVAEKLKYSEGFIACNGHGKFTLYQECLTKKRSTIVGSTSIDRDFLYQPYIFPQANMPQYYVATPYSTPAHRSFILGIDPPPANCPNNWNMWGFNYDAGYPSSGSYWQMSGIPASTTTDPAVVFRARQYGKYKIKVVGKYFVRTTGVAGSYAIIDDVSIRILRLNGSVNPSFKILTPYGDIWDASKTYATADVYVTHVVSGNVQVFRKINSTPSTGQAPNLFPLVWERANRYEANTYTEYRFLYEVETVLFKDEPVRVSDQTTFTSGLFPVSGDITVETGFTVDTFFEATLMSDGIQYGLDLAPSTNDHSELEVAVNLPNITMKNFVKAFAQMYGLILMPDPLAKNVRFVQFREIVENIPFSRDWSSRVVDSPSNIKYRLGDYGKKNNMKYSEDPNVLSGYGDSFFSIDDDTLQDETDVISLPFAASQFTISANGLPMSSVLFVDFGGGQLKPVSRVLYCCRTAPNDADQFTLLDKNTATPPVVVHSANAFDYWKTYFKDASEINGLGFDSTLMSENYTELINSLHRAKIIVVPMYLSASDVANFDHSIPVYLRQFSAYFYVNKIQNWIEGKPSKVELLRIG